MKLKTLREDVVDFAAKKAEREARQDKAADDHDWEASMGDDLFADEEKIAQEVNKKYGDELKSIEKFLNSPVMSGGFKTAIDLRHALKDLQNARKRGKEYVAKIPEQTRRAIQKATLDDQLYNTVMEYHSLFSAIEKQYGSLIQWAFGDTGENLVLISQLADLLGKARKYYLNAA